MESGWTRWILEQFEFPFTRVLRAGLDAGNLNAKYDVLILSTARFPAVAAGRRPRRREAAPARPDPDDVPRSTASQLGRVTAEARSRSCAPSSKRRHRGRAQRLGDEPRGALRAADRESPGGERRADSAREVLRARVGADRESRHHAIRSPRG